ncbi:DNA repair protein RadC, partial [Dysosmobacter welbionis]
VTVGVTPGHAGKDRVIGVRTAKIEKFRNGDGIWLSFLRCCAFIQGRGDGPRLPVDEKGRPAVVVGKPDGRSVLPVDPGPVDAETIREVQHARGLILGEERPGGGLPAGKIPVCKKTRDVHARAAVFDDGFHHLCVSPPLPDHAPDRSGSSALVTRSAQVSIEPQQRLFLHAPVECLPDGSAAVLAHLTGFLRMLQQAAQGQDHLVHIFRVYAHAAVIPLHEFPPQG